MKKTTVTIGIPAYQSEHNIGQILNSLIKQKEVIIKIEKILVFADGCTDSTIKVAKSVENPKIKVFYTKYNRGYAHALQFLIKKSTSEVFVGLNDDISLELENVIEELVKPIIKDKKVGLVGGNVIALPPKTFIGRCIYTSYLAFLPMRYRIKDGETKLTCDGKILAITKDFADSLSLTKTKIGTVDIFIYFSNLVQGRKYKFAKKAKVLYRLPETIKDFRAQEIRTRLSYEIMRKHFGKIVEIEHDFPKIEYLRSTFGVFVKYPLESILFKLIINGIYFLDKSRAFSKWGLALSTKKLSLIYLSL